MIYVEDERIKLNGVVLPGLIKSIEVTESAKVDEQEVEGSSAKPKQATGYEDAKVNIELLIDDTETQTKYERYAVLRAIFRTSGQTVPRPIPIVSEDTAAHGIDKVIFKKLTHKGENKKSQLTANLELWEYVPQTIKVACRICLYRPQAFSEHDMQKFNELTRRRFCALHLLSISFNLRGVLSPIFLL